MADAIDMANDRAQQELDQAIAACVGNYVPAESAIWCEECDTEIPEARRIAAPGCKLCVHCQGVAELKRKIIGGSINV